MIPCPKIRHILFVGKIFFQQFFVHLQKNEGKLEGTGAVLPKDTFLTECKLCEMQAK